MPDGFRHVRRKKRYGQGRLPADVERGASNGGALDTSGRWGILSQGEREVDTPRPGVTGQRPGPRRRRSEEEERRRRGERERGEGEGRARERERKKGAPLRTY